MKWSQLREVFQVLELLGFKKKLPRLYGLSTCDLSYSKIQNFFDVMVVLRISDFHSRDSGLISGFLVCKARPSCGCC